MSDAVCPHPYGTSGCIGSQTTGSPIPLLTYKLFALSWCSLFNFTLLNFFHIVFLQTLKVFSKKRGGPELPVVGDTAQPKYLIYTCGTTIFCKFIFAAYRYPEYQYGPIRIFEKVRLYQKTPSFFNKSIIFIFY